MSKSEHKIYCILRVALIYVFVISVGYNIYQSSVIDAYEQNLTELLQKLGGASK